MKRILLVLLVFTSAFRAVDLFSQNSDSKIISVTVYTDRALVTRQVSVYLAEGENHIILSSLPQQIDPSSIQVKGKGNFTLRDVKLSSKYLTNANSPRMKELLKEKRTYQYSLTEYRDHSDEIKSEKTFIQNIASMLTRSGEGSTPAELDPDKWIKMVNFYREKLSSLNDEFRSVNKKITDITREINRINREIQSIGSQQNKSVKQIEVLVTAVAKGKATLDVGYLVAGPTWVPDYTVHVDDTDKSASLMYKAVVYQSTGEDWTGVELSLSTARPALGGKFPELAPWYINVYNPVFSRSGSSGAKPETAPMMSKKAALEMTADKLPQSKMSYAQAAPRTGLTSVVFNLSGTNSVESDNQGHTVTVALITMPAEFIYSSTPKLSPFVYVQAKVTNTSAFPLLAGQTHIFSGGNFVAKTSLKTIAPGEDFKINLGIDEGFTIKRKLLNRTESTSGFFSKKTKILYTYSIEITNNKPSDRKITVWDQLPISRNSTIVVRLLKPHYTKDLPTLRKNEYNYLEWIKTIASGKTEKIPFSFSIEYPKGTTVGNLE